MEIDESAGMRVNKEGKKASEVEHVVYMYAHFTILIATEKRLYRDFVIFFLTWQKSKLGIEFSILQIQAILIRNDWV